jgi:hypothetical protein
MILVVGDKDAFDLAMALNMRANYIETGSAILSANDLRGMDSQRYLKAVDISAEQKALVNTLRAYAEVLENGA